MYLNEEYVLDILRAVGSRSGMTRADFYAACATDLNAGYRDEVDEAWSRYNRAPRA